MNGQPPAFVAVSITGVALAACVSNSNIGLVARRDTPDRIGARHTVHPGRGGAYVPYGVDSVTRLRRRQAPRRGGSAGDVGADRAHVDRCCSEPRDGREQVFLGVVRQIVRCRHADRRIDGEICLGAQRVSDPADT